ncbi:hypothetical protein Amsp01_054390 [Amycolatopsis sp. NBRC 101858]|nr:hypothetical protein Amsp01_054390 [Amycolatopsis sp. NBRC 101858]
MTNPADSMAGSRVSARRSRGAGVGREPLLAGRGLRSGHFPGSGVGRKSQADTESPPAGRVAGFGGRARSLPGAGWRLALGKVLLRAGRGLRSGGFWGSGVSRKSLAHNELPPAAAIGGRPRSLLAVEAPFVSPIAGFGPSRRHSSTLEAA